MRRTSSEFRVLARKAFSYDVVFAALVSEMRIESSLLGSLTRASIPAHQSCCNEAGIMSPAAKRTMRASVTSAATACPQDPGRYPMGRSGSRT